MAGEPRDWVDIDRAWLRSYLKDHELASGFDLDDELIGSQVSWILSAKEWARLRGAWQEHQRSLEIRTDAAQARAAEEQQAAAEARQEPINAELAEVRVRAAEVGRIEAQKTTESAKALRIATTERDKLLDEKQRMQELRRKALSDWIAFKELFRDCPDSADVGTWETLADNPVSLLNQAEKLIRMQEPRAAEQQTERELEDDVTRAQNVIAGYHVYCRKHRLAPSLEHLLDFIPVLRTEHSPAAVREAWRREAEYQ